MRCQKRDYRIKVETWYNDSTTYYPQVFKGGKWRHYWTAEGRVYFLLEEKARHFISSKEIKSVRYIYE